MSDIEVPVKVMIPAAQYRHLAKMAEANKTTVAALAHELMRRGVAANLPPTAEVKVRERKPVPVTADQANAIRRLHSVGHTDAEMGRILGVSVGTIRNRRRSIGLVSIRGRRRRLVEEQLSNQAFKRTAGNPAERSNT